VKENHCTVDRSLVDDDEIFASNESSNEDEAPVDSLILKVIIKCSIYFVFMALENNNKK
jgi:hypothetical protein